MNDEKEYVSNRIPILNQENHEKWFRQMRIQLRGKDYFYTIESTLMQHAAIATPDGKSGYTSQNTAPMEIDDAVLTQINDVKVYLNIDKKAKYQKDEASALAYICRSLSDDDEALADEYQTASVLWNYLKKKYTRTSAITANSYMTLIQTFTFQPPSQPEMTIMEAWERLKEYRRKLGAANPAAKDMYKDDSLFLILTRSLPTEYASTLDGLDIQEGMTVDTKIKHLQAKELRLKEYEQAHFARRKQGKWIIPH